MPLDFTFTEEQDAIRKAVREFAEAEIRPFALEWDETQHFPRDLFSKMGDLGLTGVLVPEELGGAGLGYVLFRCQERTAQYPDAGGR